MVMRIIAVIVKVISVEGCWFQGHVTSMNESGERWRVVM